MATHELKCWPEFFDAVADGRKTFEVRKADRDFRLGDVLVLREWQPAHTEKWSLRKLPDRYTGREVRAVVTYILAGTGIEPGYVCMGIRLEAQP